ncbi:hypothetical protein Tco_0684926 [Tanacetum coccineum]
MGTVAEYQNELEMLISRVTRKSENLLKTMYISELKVVLQIELLRRPTTFVEAFSLARMAEARFEDERTTTTIVNPNDLNTATPDQVLEESILHTSDKVEITSDNDARMCFGVNEINKWVDKEVQYSVSTLHVLIPLLKRLNDKHIKKKKMKAEIQKRI